MKKDTKYTHKNIVNFVTEENRDLINNMNTIIDAVGGTLHFKVVQDENGWYAECEEIDSIITGGEGVIPDDDEVANKIQDSINSAFSIGTADSIEDNNSPDKDVKLPAFQFQLAVHA
jgi:hypothetical protein